MSPAGTFAKISTLLLLHTITVYSSLSWTQPATPILPNGGRYGVIVGVYNRSIYLIGGATTTQQSGSMDVIQYNIDTNDYSTHTSITDSTRFNSQQYTQIDHKLYIYSSSTDYIVTYNMASNTYNGQYAPQSLKNLEDPCITNSGSDFLFILGGILSSSYNDGFYIFNLNTKLFMNDGPNMLQPRSSFTCQAHNGLLYAIGGGNAASLLDSVITLNISNISNITDENWSLLQDTLNVSRNLLQSVVNEDDIYVIGGWSGNALATVYGEVDVIDTITNTIYLDSTLATVAQRVSLVVAFDVLYAFGGYNLVDTELDTMQYALLSNTTSLPSVNSTSLTWTQSDDVSLPNGGRYGMISAFYDGSVFLIGGRTVATAGGFADVIVYDSNTNNYSIYESITENIRIYSQSFTAIDSIIYMYSSSTSDYIVTYNMASSVYNSSYITKRNTGLKDSCLTNLDSHFLFVLGGASSAYFIFNLWTHEWMNDGPNMLEERIGFTCNTHRDYLYAIGGSNNDEILDTVIVMNISNMSNIHDQNWSALTDTLHVKRNQLHSVIYQDELYVIGGWSGNTVNTVYGDVDIIDTITNTIRLDSQLYTNAYSASAVVVFNTLCVFGGYNKVDEELDTFQCATLTPTAEPTHAPTIATISPSAAPSNNPTMPPTAAPSNAPSVLPTAAPTVSPSFSPTEAPSYSPTLAPTFSPTRHPTRDGVHMRSIHIDFTLRNLSTINMDFIVHMNDTVLEVFEFIFARSYVETSKLYANEEEEVLEYRDFEVQLTDKDDKKVQYSSEEHSVTFVSNIRYEEPDTGTIITFISAKQIFISTVTISLASLLENDAIILESELVVSPEQDVISQSFDYILAGLISLMIIMSIVSIAAFIDNHRAASFIDDCKWSVLFIVGLQIVDFVSDINLCFEIVVQFTSIFDYDHALLYISGYGCILFVILPYALNISMSLKVKQYVSKNSAASIYVEQRAALITTLVVLTGSMYAVLNLISSRLFGLEIFNSGLTSFELRNLSKMKLYGTVLTENCPQLVCQLIYIAYLGGTPSSNTTLSFIASLLSIISVVLTYVVNNQSSDCYVVQYHLHMFKSTSLTNEERQQIAHNKERKDKWKKAFCESIKTPRSCIEFGYVTLMNDGCLIHVVHYLFKHQLDEMMEMTKYVETNNSSYPHLAQQYIQTLYKQHHSEVDASFNKHFAFQSSTIMKVQYFEKGSFVNSQMVQMFSVSTTQQERSLSERVEMIVKIKQLLDRNQSAMEIRAVLLDDGYNQEMIEKSFMFLNIAFDNEQNEEQEQKNETNC